MSLFTDLREVFTAYAQRIKSLAAADKQIKADLDALSQGVLSDTAKDALINCVEHIALWTDGQRNAYVEELRNALYFSTDLMRTVELADISTSKGITGLACTDGTFTVASAVNFSAVILNNSVKRMRFTPNSTGASQWFIFRQEDNGNICFGYNGSGVTKFTWDGTKYDAVSVTNQFTITVEGDGVNDMSEKTMSIVDGKIVMVGSNGKLTINQANCIGFWMRSSSYYLPTNATVNKS